MPNRLDVGRLYQAMDIVVFPSRYEGLGLVVIEAQASGLRVLASNEVPIEAKISENIDFIKLTEKMVVWEEMILKVASGNQNRNCQVDRMAESYDINKESQKLEVYYWSGLDE